jgi:hypothetical protein
LGRFQPCCGAGLGIFPTKDQLFARQQLTRGELMREAALEEARQEREEELTMLEQHPLLQDDRVYMNMFRQLQCPGRARWHHSLNY